MPDENSEPPQYEQGFLEGERSAWRRLLTEALRNLGEEDRKEAAWLVERQAIVARLRSISTEYGEADWPDDMHLGDVIENYIVPHLEHEE